MTGSIKKIILKSGKISWGYVFDAGNDENGKRIQVPKQGFAKKSDAEDALRLAIEKAKHPGVKPSHVSFERFFLDWLEQYGKGNWSPKTRQENRQRAQYAIHEFGQLALKDLTPEIIETSLFALMERGGKANNPLGSKTIKEIASLVSQALAKAVKWKLIPNNPMMDVDRPSCPPREVSIPQIAEYARFLERVKETRYYALSVFCAASGCRRGEALALQRSDITWGKNTVTISKSLCQTRKPSRLTVKPTKGKRTRHVRLSEATMAILADHLTEIDRDKALYGSDYSKLDLVFPKPDGDFQKPDQVTGRIIEYMRSAGVSASLHSLRHFHASLLLSNAVPITVIRERLGHTSTKMTLDIYSHVMKGDESGAVDTWDEETSAILSDTRPTRRKGPESSGVPVMFCDALPKKSGTSN